MATKPFREPLLQRQVDANSQRARSLFAFGGLLLTALLGGCGDAAKPTTNGAPTTTLDIDTIIHCGSLIDGLADAPLLQQSVAIRAGRIVSVMPTSQLSSQSVDATVVDLSDMTCLPGLINTHVHFDGNPEDSVDYSVYATRTAAETLQLILDNAETTLLTGFTTVRHVGAWFPDAVYEARALIERGDAAGPRIQTAGPYLTIPGGGGDLTFPEIPPEDIPPESQQGIASTPKNSLLGPRRPL